MLTAVHSGAVEGERHRLVELGGQPRPVWIVHVDHGNPRRGVREQSLLGLEVVLHRRVEIEVILRQVREDRRGQMDRVGPMQRQRVRGDLDRTRLVTGLEHRPERPLQVDRLRSRALDIALVAAHDALHRPEQAGLAAGRLQQRADQKRRRRLAVRAGHADHLQRGRRVAVEGGRGGGHRRADIGHHDLRHAQAERPLDDQRHSPALDRIAGELMPVAREPGNAEEQRARRHDPVVIGEVGDLDTPRARRRARNHLVQPHCRRGYLRPRKPSSTRSRPGRTLPPHRVGQPYPSSDRHPESALRLSQPSSRVSTRLHQGPPRCLVSRLGQVESGHPASTAIDSLWRGRETTQYRAAPAGSSLRGSCCSDFRASLKLVGQTPTIRRTRAARRPRAPTSR